MKIKFIVKVLLQIIHEQIIYQLMILYFVTFLLVCYLSCSVQHGDSYTYLRQ